MNIEKYIEHRDITGLDKIHSPFRWIVEDKQQRDSINPTEDDKLLLQKDTKRVYVSDGGKFYPITLDSAPQDGRLYGILNGEWHPVLLPVNDPFRPPEKQTNIVLNNSFNVVVDYSNASYWLGSHTSTRRDFPYNNKLGFCVNTSTNSVTVTTNRHNDTYPLRGFLELYFFNDSVNTFNIIVPVINDRPVLTLNTNEVGLVRFTYHEYGNIITATVDKRESRLFTRDCAN